MKISSDLVGRLVLVACLAGSFGLFLAKHKSNKPSSVTLEQTDTLPEKLASNDSESGPKKVYRLDLKQEEIIPIIGEIGSQSMGIAMEINKRSGQGKPTFLLLNSPGGSVLDGALIVSAVQASKAPVYTVCLQICASMAAIIHQYGKERYVVDRSILMFHDAAGGVQGNMPQMITRLTFLNRYVNKMDLEIAKRVGISLETFHNMFSGEMWLDAEDSVNKNFAEKIVSITFQSSPELNQITDKANTSSNWLNPKFIIEEK